MSEGPHRELGANEVQPQSTEHSRPLFSERANVCSGCGRRNPDDAKFCPYCGLSQPQPAVEQEQTRSVLDEITWGQVTLILVLVTCGVLAVVSMIPDQPSSPISNVSSKSAAATVQLSSSPAYSETGPWFSCLSGERLAFGEPPFPDGDPDAIRLCNGVIGSRLGSGLPLTESEQIALSAKLNPLRLIVGEWGLGVSSRTTILIEPSGRYRVFAGPTKGENAAPTVLEESSIIQSERISDTVLRLTLSTQQRMTWQYDTRGVGAWLVNADSGATELALRIDPDKSAYNWLRKQTIFPLSAATAKVYGVWEASALDNQLELRASVVREQRARVTLFSRGGRQLFEMDGEIERHGLSVRIKFYNGMVMNWRWLDAPRFCRAEIIMSDVLLRLVRKDAFDRC
jgi:hypothetical protein